MLASIGRGSGGASGTMAGRAVGYIVGGALGLGALAAAGAAGVRYWLPGVIESRAEEALHAAGFPAAKITLKRIGLEAAELAVVLAEGQGIERVHLDYTPSGLWGGRLDRVVLSGIRLELQADAGGVRPTAMESSEEPQADGSMPEVPVGEIVVEDAGLELLTPAGVIPLPVDAVVRQPESGRFGFEATAGLILGPVSGAADLAGSYGPDGLQMTFGITPADSTKTGTTGAVSGKGRVAWSGEGLPAGRAELEIAGASLPDVTPLQAGFRWLGEGERHELQALLRSGQDISAQVAAVAVREPGGHFRVSGTADLIAEKLEEAVRLAGAGLPVTGRGSLSLRVADAPVPGAVPPMDVAVRLERTGWADLASNGVIAASGRVERLGDGGWLYESDGDLTVEAVPSGTMKAALPPELGSSPLFLSLRPPPEGPLRVTASPAEQGWRIAAAGTFGLEAGQAAAGGQLESLEIVTGSDGLAHAALSLMDVGLDASPWGVAARGLEAAATYAPAMERPLALKVSAGTVRIAGNPAPVAPFALNATVSGDPQGILTFQTDASAASGSIVLEAFGTANISSGTGQADIQLYPVRFGQGGRKPAELSPLLAQYAEEAEGTVALKARAGWGKGATPGRAELLLEDVSLTGPSFVLQGLNAVVTADKLQPLHMPEQELSIGLLDVGIPLSDGLVRFAVPESETLRVGQAEFAWAGGSVRAQPFAADLSSMTGSVTLEAEGLELGQVLSMAGVDGLAATGTLNGRIPVIVEKNGVRFEQGRLDAAGPGTLRYDPADPPSFLDPGQNDSTGLVMQVLQNFHYTELGITIDGSAGGEMEVKLRVRGSNPDFYDGYPVALNLNLSGALASILQSGVTSYRIPETVKARIEQFRNTGQ